MIDFSIIDPECEIQMYITHCACVCLCVQSTSARIRSWATVANMATAASTLTVTRCARATGVALRSDGRASVAISISADAAITCATMAAPASE